ncbi:glucosaminidase domain-containing protein [Aerococcus sp. 1KP-2016]|uniref:glucosaminidase domain-containing protein n=1 Tax=Aerococcus sp. 1KP-2016 TaxID=1981982 RepID=UPI001F2A5FDC|nr:glucosaminidase domain-containing protein [Aerococcus sp. 1KP-2016]
MWQSQDTTVEDGSTGTVTETPTEDYTDQEFIQLIGEYAVAEYPKSQVLPSIVVAQAVLESDFGRSDYPVSISIYSDVKPIQNRNQVWIYQPKNS